MLMRTSTRRTAMGNRFVAQLSAADAALLEDILEPVVIAPQTVLAAIGARLEAVYFPETIIVSIGSAMFAGQQVETAVVGYEGIVGWSVFSGAERATHDARVQMGGGIAWRASHNDIRRVCEASATLLDAVMRFADVITVQMAEAIVSLLRDSVELRLCRWLLMRHDRLDTDELRVRHDEISDNLGVRRASVTDGLHILEGERLIRCHRGRIEIRDRSGLEQRAAGAYGETEAYYRERIGPFGRGTARSADRLAPASLAA